MLWHHFIFLLVLYQIKAEGAVGPDSSVTVVPLTREITSPRSTQDKGTLSFAASSFLRGSRTTAKAQSSTGLHTFTPAFYAYFASVSFDGEQKIDVLVDTGSANLLVPAQLCYDCKEEVTQKLNIETAKAKYMECSDAKCKGSCTEALLKSYDLESAIRHPLYCGPHGGTCTNLVDNTDISDENHQQSSETRCLFYDSFADGSWAAGYLVSGPVSFAGVHVNSSYGVITAATDDFWEAPWGGGVLGMAYGTEDADCNLLSCFPPLYDDVVSRGHVYDVFAICGSKEEPIMTIGGGDQRLYQGTLQYAHLQEPIGTYIVNVAGLEVENHRIPDDKGVNAIIDTGSTGIIFPTKTYKSFKTYLQQYYCHVPGVCISIRGDGTRMSFSPDTIFDDNTWLSFNKTQLDQLPTLSIVLSDGPVLNVTPHQYMARQAGYKEEDGPAYYSISISTSSAWEKMYVIGESVLNHYYVEFDRDKRRLGIATSVANCTQALAK